MDVEAHLVVDGVCPYSCPYSCPFHDLSYPDHRHHAAYPVLDEWSYAEPLCGEVLRRLLIGYAVAFGLCAPSISTYDVSRYPCLDHGHGHGHGPLSSADPVCSCCYPACPSGRPSYCLDRLCHARCDCRLGELCPHPHAVEESYGPTWLSYRCVWHALLEAPSCWWGSCWRWRGVESRFES